MMNRIKVDIRRGRQSGLTLLELMITLTVFAVLLGWSLPAFNESVQNHQLSAQNNELVAILAYARSEAIRRNTTVPVVLSSTANGWNAIIDDPADEAEVEGCVPGQLRCTTQSNVTFAFENDDEESGPLTIAFNNRGYIRDVDDAWTGETLYLQHSHCSGGDQRRRVDLTPTGQINSCSLPCDSEAACP